MKKSYISPTLDYMMFETEHIMVVSNMRNMNVHPDAEGYKPEESLVKEHRYVEF